MFTLRPLLPRAAVACAAFVLLPLPRLPEVSQTYSGPPLLRGLRGVAVLAEQVHSEIRPFGLDEAWLERRVSAALQRDSVPTLTRWEALRDERQPLLVVRLETVPVPAAGAFAWHLSLSMQQRVRPVAGDTTTTLATTWEAESTLGATSGKLLRASVGRSLDDRTRQFVDVWRQRQDE